MEWSDLKYLASYSIPASLAAGFLLGGVFYWFTPIFTFLLIPLMEVLLPVNHKNLSKTEKEIKNHLFFFDALLYLNLLMVYSVLGYSLWLLSTVELPLDQQLGIVFSCGIVMGSNGINVAHELGHRSDLFSRICAKLLLLPSLYSHFYIEHNFGHHLHAATPEDPATARYRQSVYSFWITSVTRQYFKAWKIQSQLLRNDGLPFLSVKNDMFWATLFQLGYLIVVGYLFGIFTVLYAIGIAVVSFLLLETINYIEHYGLLRTKLPSGRYERVREVHSWNSDHIMGRIMLYELTRHSDHHYRASKKYQVLDNHETSPQMPFGYPTSMVLSLLPPLWFRIMNPRIPEKMKQLAA
ncbi:alkane 1-monooxygenase [Robertkochia flava]|uniref:alkane 1-monooxygenase n=1 Tax=Robertkochia flava TaxID=3447986 RepID=UPI001CCC49BF|nr:alkane 1-monooxygenase [Robertkochia marina]